MTNNHLLINLSFLFSKPTGLGTYATSLFPYLQSLNPTLLVSNNYSDYKCYPVPPALTQDQGTKGNVNRLLWTQLKIPQIYQKLKADLLFSPIPEAPIYSKCRFVVTVHDLIPLRFPRPNSLLTLYCRYYLPQVLAQSKHIICDSNATARDIQDFFGISAAKITPIPLAYNSGHFQLLNISNEEIKQNHPYFLYIGRHDPYKNLQRLIEAFSAIYNCRDYQLWIVGSSDQRYTPKLKKQANELGLSDQIKFLDYVPYNELPIILNKAITLVFPSLWEGFGLPVLEAMACGTPVITSNISSLPEVAGDAALLVNPYNIQEITNAMQTIAENSQLRSHLSYLSLQQAKQFSWNKTGQATREILENYL